MYLQTVWISAKGRDNVKMHKCCALAVELLMLILLPGYIGTEDSSTYTTRTRVYRACQDGVIQMFFTTIQDPAAGFLVGGKCEARRRRLGS